VEEEKVVEEAIDEEVVEQADNTEDMIDFEIQERTVKDGSSRLNAMVHYYINACELQKLH
jgi:hypothetical protein